MSAGIMRNRLLGAPEYTADTFGAKRYELLATRSRGHSLPVVNGCEQAAGVGHAALWVEARATTRGFLVVMDLTACYPSTAGVGQLLRRIELRMDQGSLEVEDQLSSCLGADLETALLTLAKEGSYQLEPLAGSISGGVETLTFQGHTGNEEIVWRWKWKADGRRDDDWQAVGYRILI
ncbi:MAG: hypothetical protein WAM11_06795 [Cyanobium sp.]